MKKKARILVVDDELPVCKSIRSALANKSSDVDMALSGEEALRMFEEQEYDVVLTDLMMPGISGMDLLKDLSKKRSEVKVIMITGYPSITTAVQSVKLGAFNYIPKPFTPEELRSQVSRALESKQYHEKEAAEAEALGESHRKEVHLPKGVYGIPENSWVQLQQDGSVRVGIHHVFLRTIDKVTSLEVANEGETRYQGEACIRVTDSHNHTHRVWAPVSGKVIGVNQDVQLDFAKLMEDPYGRGWVLSLQPTHLDKDLQNLVPLEGT